MRFEAVDDDMARVLRSMTGAERLKIASGMYASARKMLLSHLRTRHPEWTDDEVQREAIHRLSHGAL
jgi:hypothetical protein